MRPDELARVAHDPEAFEVFYREHARRRSRHRHRARVKVSAGGRVHERRLRPGTLYLYRVVAVNAEGHRSSTLRVRVRTHRH